uniref:Uncharacterized protein n=1 Tax=Clandestinovirus TaxID=2831644 RepID=A0A8F8KUC6_9VIRU|nr:hypothetical protein KOM_12_515 [Clandestinovirus]
MERNAIPVYTPEHGIAPGDFTALYNAVGYSIGGPFCAVEGFTEVWKKIHDSPRMYHLALTLNPPQNEGWVFWNAPEANELRKGAFGDWSDSTTGGFFVRHMVEMVRMGWDATVKCHFEAAARSAAK